MNAERIHGLSKKLDEKRSLWTLYKRRAMRATPAQMRKLEREIERLAQEIVAEGEVTG